MRKFLLASALQGAPIGLGYASFSYIVMIWLKQAGLTNTEVSFGRLLLLPILLHTLPLRLLGTKHLTLNMSFGLLCSGALLSALGEISLYFLLVGAFVGCYGMGLFECFWGQMCSQQKAGREAFVSSYVLGYRLSSLLGKGGCVFLASFVSWPAVYVCIFFLFYALYVSIKQFSSDSVVLLDPWGREWPRLLKHIKAKEWFIIIFFMLPDSFFEAMIVPYWMDAGVTLLHIGLAKGGVASLGALFGITTSVWIFNKGVSLKRYILMLLPFNIVVHLLPLFFLYKPSFFWIYIVSFFAHMGHGLMKSGYFIYITRFIVNASQYEFMSIITYVASILGCFSGFLYEVLGLSWTRFLVAVALLNFLTFALLWKSRDT